VVRHMHHNTMHLRHQPRQGQQKAHVPAHRHIPRTKRQGPLPSGPDRHLPTRRPPADDRRVHRHHRHRHHQRHHHQAARNRLKALTRSMVITIGRLRESAVSIVSGFATAARLFVDLFLLLLRLLLWLLTSWLSLWKRRAEKTGRTNRTAPDCIPMSHPAFKVPDPLIYSQEYLMELGSPVTWDNPDIVLRKDGVDVASSALEPDTDYEIVAQIWNGSTDAPVVGLPVSFSYLAFGVGTQSFPITDPQDPVLVTLGGRGGPDHPAFAVTKWRTPSVEGHYCIQAKLHPASDANYANNLGQENTLVGVAHSAAEFIFALRNSTDRQTTIRFATDTYVL